MPCKVPYSICLRNRFDKPLRVIWLWSLSRVEPYFTIYLISTKRLEPNVAEHQFTHKFKKTNSVHGCVFVVLWANSLMFEKAELLNNYYTPVLKLSLWYISTHRNDVNLWSSLLSYFLLSGWAKIRVIQLLNFQVPAWLHVIPPSNQPQVRRASLLASYRASHRSLKKTWLKLS